jgi:hypothetical protein
MAGVRSRARLLTLLPLLAVSLVVGGTRATAATTLWPAYHFDAGRSGNDSGEPSFSGLGNAWNSNPLDGTVFAEPLVDGNTVIVATENDSVYGFDASSGSVRWGPINLGAPRTTNFPCGDIDPLGITGTPVIDGGFLYVLAEVQTSSSSWEFHLAKIDPSNGSVSYSDNVTPTGMVTNVEQERSALAVSSGNVVITWGGLDGDCGTYHGYVETVSEATGAEQHQWNDTSESGGREGGMWGPSGAAVDSSGNIYVTTGNGSSTTVTNYDFGDSVLKFSPTLSLLSWFAPGGSNSWASLNANDTDLGSVGPSLLPSGHLFAIGKGGLGYVLNQSALPDNSNPGGGENAGRQVCHATADAAFGGLAVSGNTVLVPCADGIAAVSVDPTSSAISPLWYQANGIGSAPVIAGGVVWTLKMFGGTTLQGLRPDTGGVVATLSLPGTTAHFATPAAGDGMLFVGAGNRLAAFAPGAVGQATFTPANVGAPSATVTPNGSTQLVFWKGAANHLFEGWYAGGFWHGPADLTASVFGGAAPLQSAPSATVSADGSTQLVFWQGAGGHLFEAWYAAGAWHGPLDVTATQLGSAAPLTSSPTVAVTPDGSQQLVYWRGAANHLFEAWYAGGRWNGPLDLTGSVFGGASPLSSAPTATVTRDGSTQVVFWQGPGNHLFEAWYAGGRWNGPVDWTTAAFGGAGTLTSAPSVTTTPDGSQQLVYWEGAGQHLFEAWYAGGHWNGPLDLTGSVFGGAGPLTSAPSAIVTPDGSTQLVFWQGPGQTLWEAWYTGRWNGPLDLSAGG